MPSIIYYQYQWKWFWYLDHLYGEVTKRLIHAAGCGAAGFDFESELVSMVSVSLIFSLEKPSGSYKVRALHNAPLLNLLILINSLITTNSVATP